MAVVSALVPLFLANPQLYKKGIAPTAVSAKERPASMLYVFKNDSLDPHLPALQLKFPGIGHTLRGAILSANPAERAPVPSYPIPIARLIRMTSKSSEREADKKLVKRHTSISGLLRVSIVWFYKAAKRACLSRGTGIPC